MEIVGMIKQRRVETRERINPSPLG